MKKLQVKKLIVSTVMMMGVFVSSATVLGGVSTVHAEGVTDFWGLATVTQTDDSINDPNLAVNSRGEIVEMSFDLNGDQKLYYRLGKYSQGEVKWESKKRYKVYDNNDGLYVVGDRQNVTFLDDNTVLEVHRKNKNPDDTQLFYNIGKLHYPTETTPYIDWSYMGDVKPLDVYYGYSIDDSAQVGLDSNDNGDVVITAGNYFIKMAHWDKENKTLTFGNYTTGIWDRKWVRDGAGMSYYGHDTAITNDGKIVIADSYRTAYQGVSENILEVKTYTHSDNGIVLENTTAVPGYPGQHPTITVNNQGKVIIQAVNIYDSEEFPEKDITQHTGNLNVDGSITWDKSFDRNGNNLLGIRGRQPEVEFITDSLAISALKGEKNDHGYTGLGWSYNNAPVEIVSVSSPSINNKITVDFKINSNASVTLRQEKKNTDGTWAYQDYDVTGKTIWENLSDWDSQYRLKFIVKDSDGNITYETAYKEYQTSIPIGIHSVETIDANYYDTVFAWNSYVHDNINSSTDITRVLYASFVPRVASLSGQKLQVVVEKKNQNGDWDSEVHDFGTPDNVTDAVAWGQKAEPAVEYRVKARVITDDNKVVFETEYKYHTVSYLSVFDTTYTPLSSKNIPDLKIHMEAAQVNAEYYTTNIKPEISENLDNIIDFDKQFNESIKGIRESISSNNSEKATQGLNTLKEQLQNISYPEISLDMISIFRDRLSTDINQFKTDAAEAERYNEEKVVTSLNFYIPVIEYGITGIEHLNYSLQDIDIRIDDTISGVDKFLENIEDYMSLSFLGNAQLDVIQNSWNDVLDQAQNFQFPVN
ncbi:HBL/NHE enterotoxin family protein [Cytobacillus sp. Hm23]